MLEDKYRKDKLSLKELYSLREEVNSRNDKELEDMLQKTWADEDFDTSGISDAHMDKIKKRIDIRVGFRKDIHHIFIKIGRIAAAVLLPLLTITTLYFYRESSWPASEEITVSTHEGERATITLPDGTKVMLNSDSQLSYLPKNYNKKRREIKFKGNGYFQVAENKERPFLIDSEAFKVQVLGTVFNLSAYTNSPSVELSLEEGSVLFFSSLTKKSVILKPDQKAILNLKNGTFSVETEENIKQASAWTRGELIFRNIPLSEVIKDIELYYGVQITLEEEAFSSDLFTGIIPTSGINEALEILEISYGLEAHMKNRKVTLIRK